MPMRSASENEVGQTIDLEGDWHFESNPKIQKDAATKEGVAHKVEADATQAEHPRPGGEQTQPGSYEVQTPAPTPDLG